MLAQLEKEEIWENICNERNPSPKEQDRNSQLEHLETKKSKAVDVDQEKGGPPRDPRTGCKAASASPTLS